MKWYEEEEMYLKVLHDICVQLAKEYMQLYIYSHKIQTTLRLPSIILSSLSGVASFGSSSFGEHIQRYINISVGIVNVGIAIVQTYESYLKIGDIVSKSLSCSSAFKKLADTIYCETYIPVENRNANGITFLRDCFARYQTILDQAPPLEFHGKSYSESLKKAQNIMETIRAEINSTPRMSSIITPATMSSPVALPESSIDIKMENFRDMKSVISAGNIRQKPETHEVP